MTNSNRTTIKMNKNVNVAKMRNFLEMLGRDEVFADCLGGATNLDYIIFSHFRNGMGMDVNTANAASDMVIDRLARAVRDAFEV
jgi:hypothetical protein